MQDQFLFKIDFMDDIDKIKEELVESQVFVSLSPFRFPNVTSNTVSAVFLSISNGVKVKVKGGY